MSRYTYPVDPNSSPRNRLRKLMARGAAASNHDESLRIAIFGDSTMTCPGGYGVLPMHHLNARLGQLFGNIPGTQLHSLLGTSGAPYIAASGQAVQTSPLASTHDAAGIFTKGVPYTGESGSYAADIRFQPYSQLFASSRQILAGSTFFPTANQRLEIYCSKRADSAESLLIEYRPTDKAFSLFEAILTSQQETLAVSGLNAAASTYELIRVRTVNAYNPSAGKPYPQWWIKSGVATTVGAGSATPPLINGVRVLNENPVGAIVDTLSAGGYTSRLWFGDTVTGGAGGTHINAAPQTVQLGHDIWIFNLGTNDFYGGITAADWRRNYYDPDGANNHGMIGEFIDECEARSITVPLIILTIPLFRADDGLGTYAGYKAQHELALTQAHGLADELQAAGYDCLVRDTKSEADAMGFNAIINDFQGLTDRGSHSTSSVSYALNDFVLATDGRYYRCIAAHTSSATNEPTDDGSNNVAIPWRPLHLHLDGAPSGSNVVHWSDKGAAVWAETTAGLLREHYGASNSTLDTDTIAAIVSAINADATQITQQTNAATAATQATSAAADTVAAIKADPELGTADGGLVSNAAMLGVAIDGYTFTEAQRLMLAAMVGPITGGGTGTNVIKGADESKARITGTYDNLGNRTPTIIDAT